MQNQIFSALKNIIFAVKVVCTCSTINIPTVAVICAALPFKTGVVFSENHLNGLVANATHELSDSEDLCADSPFSLPHSQLQWVSLAIYVKISTTKRSNTATWPGAVIKNGKHNDREYSAKHKIYSHSHLVRRMRYIHADTEGIREQSAGFFLWDAARVKQHLCCCSLRVYCFLAAGREKILAFKLNLEARLKKWRH